MSTHGSVVVSLAMFFIGIPLLSSENSSNLLCVEFTNRNSVAHPPMENLERIDWKFVRQPIRNALVED